MSKKIKKQDELVKKKSEIVRKSNDGFIKRANDTCYKCGGTRYFTKGICKDGFACNFTPGLENE